MRKSVLLIDNTIDTPWDLGLELRRYLPASIQVRRAPQEDLPSSIENWSHVILSGSKTSIFDSSSWVKKLLKFLEKIIESHIPLLGICYGHQCIARLFHGLSSVQRSSLPEVGWGNVHMQHTKNSPLPFRDLPPIFSPFQYHFEEVKSLGPEFSILGSSERCPIQAYAHHANPIYGIQFHPERTWAEGEKVLHAKRNELHKDCFFTKEETLFNYDENIAKIIFSNFCRL